MLRRQLKMLDSLRRNYPFVRQYPPGHFYSPIPELGEVNQRSRQLFDQSMTRLPGIDVDPGAARDLAYRLRAFASEAPFSDRPDDRHRYHFDNVYFSFGDGIVLYSMLRHFRPRRVVEVGSGYSSALMLDTAERHLDDVRFTFIEPYPERLNALLTTRDRRTVSVIESRVQDVPDDVFDALEPSDLLFIDSSHVAKIGSDVIDLVFRVLPRLKPGVLVQFHDIPWPFEYPESWLVRGRAWNEAYFVRALLQDSDAFRILFFNSYMAVHHRDVLGECLPQALRTSSFPETEVNSSLWLIKNRPTGRMLHHINATEAGENAESL